VTDIIKKNIVFLGRNGVGKSSLMNSFVGKSIQTVPEELCPNSNKSMPLEIVEYGNLILVDAVSVDDPTEEGFKKLNQTIRAISIADFIIVVLDGRERLSPIEFELFTYIKKISVPFVIAVNKIEFGVNQLLLSEIKWINAIHFEISCAENVGIDILKAKVIRSLRDDEPPLISDIVSPGDVVVLVVPNDSESAKGKFIIPQAQTIKEALEEDTIVIIAKESELRSVLYALKNKPDLIIAETHTLTELLSQVPEETRITTFSTIMSRYKGNLKAFLKGINIINELKDGDKVLVAEGCPEHEQEEDKIREVIPDWLKSYLKKNIFVDYNGDNELPEDLSKYKLVIHCNGCKLSRQCMHSRIKQSALMDVPIINYGILHSFMHNTISREIVPFGKLSLSLK
jgi:[FeFe] hydrogenase H-cluster maturation GTPase HydF